jgi:hypothetical protein
MPSWDPMNQHTVRFYDRWKLSYHIVYLGYAYIRKEIVTHSLRKQDQFHVCACDADRMQMHAPVC